MVSRAGALAGPSWPEGALPRCLGWEDPLEKGKGNTPVFWPGEFLGITKNQAKLSYFHVKIMAVGLTGQYPRMR